MCNVIEYKLDGRSVRSADIKKKYIANIVNSAKLCGNIERIVLFGSALEDRCRKDSDVDIAVFGNGSPSKILRTKSYNSFVNSIYKFDLDQNYDILYFDIEKKYSDPIFDDISKGVVLYEK